MREKNMILAADIGGTKTRLAVFAEADSSLKPVQEGVFPSANYQDIADVIRAFLSSGPEKVSHAVLAVAGPVTKGQAKLTNLPWSLTEERLKQEMGFQSVSLINDMLAMAVIVPHLQGKDLYPLQTGHPDPLGNRAVVAPGTGLGEAFMTPACQDRWYAFATEGGHGDYASSTEEGRAFTVSLYEKEQRVSAEKVCGGQGIYRIYQYLQGQFPHEESPCLRDAVAAAADPVPIIVDGGMRSSSPCPLCVRTLRLYATLLGSEAGNMALKVMAMGGVYLGGGIPPRILPFLREGGFLQSFRVRGRMSFLLEAAPVHVILETRAPLLGAFCWWKERRGINS
ncbi:MAG: glucokinase [Syntrophobacterales bacterium]|jgi:glucokinase|nr:glucokinase [Syntrophobacterales bacterium]